MSKTEFILAFEALLQAPQGSIKGADQLADLENWTSLTVIDFLVFADERFGVTLAPARLESCHTVDDLMALFPNLTE